MAHLGNSFVRMNACDTAQNLRFCFPKSYTTSRTLQNIITVFKKTKNERDIHRT